MRKLRTAAAALAVVMVATGQTAYAADAASTITIDSAHPAGRLPADFVGLSFEMRELGIGNLDASKGNVAQFFKTLGRSNVRIGGNTLDRDTLWVPEAQQPPNPLPGWVQDVVRPSDIKRLDKLLRNTGWNAEVGINVGRWDQALGADQAKVMFEVLGKRLVAAECGNEPDQWVSRAYRPTGYAYADYKKDWETCAAAVGSNRIAGPDTASTSSSWAASLATDNAARMNMVTVHQYPGGATTTTTKLLSQETLTGGVNAVSKNLAAAKAAGLPMRVDEANSTYNGGIDGVSNKFASALWVIDYSMSLAQAGVSGVNIHGGLGVCNDPIWNGKFQRYTPFCAADKAGELAQVYKAMPIYYGLWMARQMGPGKFLPLNLTTDRNITAYAVKGDDSKTRIAILQKDETSAAAAHVDIKVGGHNRSAEVLRMTGTALADEPTAIQGSTVDAKGKLKVRPDSLRVRNGSLGIDLAAGSAVVITIDC
ncbi:glycosyl hydrolase family 79 C-terminal domain-containing protein [Actinocrispum sp. NPDC049592]|uniref:glycosyl hydrolase family 79 C-terminal domain-containing protein n=1 Tax=Actinocrispum sp. NPDC049592 TaxID=3154835 RepID=UPI00343FCB7B